MAMSAPVSRVGPQNWLTRDAALTHIGNGIYGGMWVAAMVAAAYVLDSPAAVIRAGLAEIPPQSRFHEAISDVLTWCEINGRWEDTLRRIQQKHGAYYRADERFNWVQTIPNACLVRLRFAARGARFWKKHRYCCHGRLGYRLYKCNRGVGRWGNEWGRVIATSMDRSPQQHLGKLYSWLQSPESKRAG